MPESSRPHDAWSQAVPMARAALGHAPAGILTDFDGTLSPIVRDPGEARLADGAGGALEALGRGIAVVAIVTGRAAMDVRRMTGLTRVLVVGNHGTEWLEPGAGTPEEPGIDADGMREALDATLALLPTTVGVAVEEKGLSATVHYRNAPDPAAARAAILEALGEPDARIEVREGRMSVELRPAGAGNKGTATREIVDRYRLRGLLVLGDDLTDVDMFAAAAALRAEGVLEAAIIGVGGGGGEVPPQVAATADLVLDDPSAVAGLLGALAEERRLSE